MIRTRSFQRMLKNLARSSVNAIPWGARSLIKHLPIVADVQRRIVERFLADDTFVHTINAGPAKGLRYPISLPDDKAIWIGNYEKSFTHALARAVSRDAVCFDIGGYRGFFSGVLGLAGAKHVHVFEPLPANCRHILNLISENPQLQIHLSSLAIGEERGTARFAVMSEASMGKLESSPFQRHRPNQMFIEVTVETLDHLVGEGFLPPPDLIKVDVEGAEALVLRGGQRTLSTFHPAIFLEIHSSALASECDRLLRSFGYCVSVIETGLPPDSNHSQETCHFMARKLNIKSP